MGSLVGEGEEDQHSPLLMTNFGDTDAEKPFQRTGTIWTAVAHVITGIIGAGVLSLAWSTAQLGWIAGPLIMVVFAAITILSANLLCDCYRSPDPECGPDRNKSYMDAVQFYLGENHKRVCGVVLNEGFYGTAVAYVITSAASVKAIEKSNCYHKQGHDAPCNYGDTRYMLLFGGVQIIVSQIPSFHNMAWLSIVAAIMSFTYAFIGLGLGFAKVVENREIKGSIGGVAADSTADKVWLVLQAIGDIAFAYPYTVILLEIQDTLKSPPPERKTMKKASTTAIFITTFFYLCCGCFGYAAFGSDTPGNLLTGFGFYEPYWLVDFANACIVLHLVGGYQVYSQPVFAFVEGWFGGKFPNSGFVNNFYSLKLPLIPAFQLNPLRLCFRTAYVVSSTVIAIIFPYFNQVLGVLGAFNFWPLAIYFPVEMYFVQRKIGSWTTKWVVLQTVSIACLIVSILALIGSVQGLISAKLS
ncbi:probable amino acid permease 7 [Rhododendron vialii]|uniref:probable amino acid permease 7 n=1 Tax=Rhododendron vialii TaxID=182163 RepID=UPI00265FA3C3|nr:probable amino acid permease 7 [Rhododendron vialii]